MCTINYDIISSSSPSSRPDPFLFSSFKPHLPTNHVSFPTRVGSIRLKASRSENPVTTPLSNMSFYELLGIPETGSLVDIKQAYKQLARKYHPDVSPPGLVEENTKRFIRVQEAYETLSDPGQRAMYDEYMAKGIHLAFSSRKNYQNNEVYIFFLFFIVLKVFYSDNLVFIFKFKSWVIVIVLNYHIKGVNHFGYGRI